MSVVLVYTQELRIEDVIFSVCGLQQSEICLQELLNTMATWSELIETSNQIAIRSWICPAFPAARFEKPVSHLPSVLAKPPVGVVVVWLTCVLSWCLKVLSLTIAPASSVRRPWLNPLQAESSANDAQVRKLPSSRISVPDWSKRQNIWATTAWVPFIANLNAFLGYTMSVCLSHTSAALCPNEF